jgi:hypothetical protein
MPLLEVVVVLVIAGVGLWAVNRFIPMAPAVKTILNVVVVIVIALWLLQGFGMIDGKAIKLN